MREEQSTFTPKTEQEYTLEQKINDLILIEVGWNTDAEGELYNKARTRLQKEGRRIKLENEAKRIEEQLKQLK